MSLFEANLVLLQRRFPAFIERLRREPHNPRLVLRETNSSAPTLLVMQESGGALALHHPKDPMGYARQTLAQTNGVHSAQCLLLIDCGLGYLPLAIHELGVPRLRVYLFQPSIGVFRAALQTIDWRPLLTNPAVEIVVGCEAGIVAQALTPHLMELAANPPLLIDSPAISGAFPQWSQTIQQEIRETLQFAQSGLLTKFKDGPLTLRNLLANLDSITETPGLSQIGDALRGVPAIVAAAGPSLAKNIDQLRGAEERVFILATDTAFEPLRRAGVRPHCVVTVDPTELNLRHFRQEKYDNQTCLLFDPEARPEIVARFDHRLTFLTDKHDFFLWLDSMLGGKGLMKKGGMVSQAGIQAAAYLGCSPIILVGQDLALDAHEGATHHPDAALRRNVRFLPDDHSHVETPSLTDQSMKREPLFWVEGIDGNPVPTVQSFLIYIRLLEEDFRSMNTHIIDATEGGAKIAGTEILPLKEALRRYKPAGVNFSNRWKRASSGITAQAPPSTDVKRYLGQLLETRLCEAEELEIQARNASQEPLQQLEARLDYCRNRLFSDPAAEYLIEYGAPRELFDYLKLGPADASPDERRIHLQRRLNALTEAVRAAYAQLRDVVNH